MVVQRTSSKRVKWGGIIFLLWATLYLAACGTNETAAQCPDIECPEEVSFPKPILYEDLWAVSAHADRTSNAFTHWDEEEPPEIPVECAKCHSRPGFIAFIGADDSSSGVVENPSKVGTTVTCYVCHNEVSLDIDSVEFSSGVKIRGLGSETRCILCHQGRASTMTVNEMVSELNLTDADTPSEELEFINSHYISGATQFGSEVQGAYQYDNQLYAGRFVRGDEFFSCINCHETHTLELQFDTCGECHTIRGSEPKDIRVNTTDFDGDGDSQEGVFYEIETIHSALLEAIQKYAKEVVGTSIAYEPNIYPYFFIDTSNNGVIEPEEATYLNRYLSWTPRLVKAAYNYNYIFRDPGAYAHNSTYILQILYDSLIDIGGDEYGFVRP